MDPRDFVLSHSTDDRVRGHFWEMPRRSYTTAATGGVAAQVWDLNIWYFSGYKKCSVWCVFLVITHKSKWPKEDMCFERCHTKKNRYLFYEILQFSEQNCAGPPCSVIVQIAIRTELPADLCQGRITFEWYFFHFSSTFFSNHVKSSVSVFRWICLENSKAHYNTNTLQMPFGNMIFR